MKIYITFLLLLVSITQQLFAQPKSTCIADTNQIYSFHYNSKLYQIIKEKKTWMDAAACAVARGGHLVEIADSLEQLAVYSAIIGGAAIPNNYTTAPDGGNIAYIWIGASDRATEGTWLWDGNNDSIGTVFFTGEGNNGAGTGVVSSGMYANWGGNSNGFNEPDNYAFLQNAAGIGLKGWPSGSGSLGSAGQWNDINSNNQLYYVIEYEVTSGMHTLSNANEIQVYPNPVTNTLFVKSSLNSTTNQLIRIYDSKGALVLQKSCNQASVEIETASFSKGIYLLQISSTNESFITKFIKE